MRRLTKAEKPNTLVRNEVKWTAAYVAAVHAGVDASKNERWRNPEIKSSLSSETLGKCAYCEASVGDRSYAHVEHMIPKKLKPELAHQWDNLTIACPVCNTKKEDFYHPTEGLLNPYADDLDEHLCMMAGMVDWRLGKVRGEVTVRRLELNRIDLVRLRIERIGKIKEMLERWHVSAEPLRSVLADGIRLDVRNGEFTSTVEAYLATVDFPVEPGRQSVPI